MLFSIGHVKNTQCCNFETFILKLQLNQPSKILKRILPSVMNQCIYGIQLCIVTNGNVDFLLLKQFEVQSVTNLINLSLARSFFFLFLLYPLTIKKDYGSTRFSFITRPSGCTCQGMCLFKISVRRLLKVTCRRFNLHGFLVMYQLFLALFYMCFQF